MLHIQKSQEKSGYEEKGRNVFKFISGLELTDAPPWVLKIDELSVSPLGANNLVKLCIDTGQVNVLSRGQDPGKCHMCYIDTGCLPWIECKILARGGKK